MKLPHTGIELDLDKTIERVVKRNFDEKAGAPYWIDYAKEHKLKPNYSQKN